MRHVGILFRIRGCRVVHISQGAVRPGGFWIYRALCDERAVEAKVTVVGRPRRFASSQRRSGSFCKKCMKSAESIGRAIGWYESLVPNKGETRRVKV